MRKWVLTCLVLLIGTLGLSGCEYGRVEEMYALPKSSEAYINLQAKINQEKGSAEYIAPLSGENRQTIQLVDVDGDGNQEAVAFFRDTADEEPLKIVIFKQDSRGEYQAYAHIKGMGSEIDSIDYVDLGGSGSIDILVSWQVSAAVHSLVGYTISDGQPIEIMRSGYSRYLTADFDQDGLKEIILAQIGSNRSPGVRIEYYDGQDGIMELMSTVPLSEGATDISSWQVGLLEGNVPALFTTSFCGKDMLVTDVLCLKDGQELKNISLDPNTRRGQNVFHYYAGVQPEDINGDGLIEVPVAVPVPTYGDSTGDQFWWLQWMHYKPDGKRELVLTTYHSGDGWYLELPKDWKGLFFMRRQESSIAGIRTMIFAKGDGIEEPQPFLEISSLMGSDRARQAEQGTRFILHSDATTIYTAEFIPSDWDCGLQQEDVQKQFHAGLNGWKTGR